ncbi:MAG: pseudouridine synthase [Myxococcota bacterium]
MRVRLDKLLADRGVGSRSELRTAIKRGRVTVDAAVVRDPGAHVGPDAEVCFDGAVVPAPPELVVLHKPVGVHSTVGDPLGRANLEGLTRDLLDLGLHPVGRLDHDSSGLLPFSRDGALTQILLHPRHAVPKEYVATVEGAVPADLGARLAAGVETGEGVHVAELLDVREQAVRLVVREGKHRMVRRMLANLGLPVLELRRERFGALELGELAPGAWRVATPEERAWSASLREGRG